jgi:hypothetical protein
MWQTNTNAKTTKTGPISPGAGSERRNQLEVAKQVISTHVQPRSKQNDDAKINRVLTYKPPETLTRNKAEKLNGEGVNTCCLSVTTGIKPRLRKIIAKNRH